MPSYADVFNQSLSNSERIELFKSCQENINQNYIFDIYEKLYNSDFCFHKFLKNETNEKYHQNFFNDYFVEKISIIIKENQENHDLEMQLQKLLNKFDPDFIKNTFFMDFVFDNYFLFDKKFHIFLSQQYKSEDYKNYYTKKIYSGKIDFIEYVYPYHETQEFYNIYVFLNNYVHLSRSSKENRFNLKDVFSGIPEKNFTEDVYNNICETFGIKIPDTLLIKIGNEAKLRLKESEKQKKNEEYQALLDEINQAEKEFKKLVDYYEIEKEKFRNEKQFYEKNKENIIKSEIRNRLNLQ